MFVLVNVHEIQKNAAPPRLAFVQQITYLYSPSTSLISAYILFLTTSSFPSLFLSFFISPLIFPSRSFIQASIPFAFHLSPLSYLSFFPLELSLHTIANNLVKELHLCSHAFSINSSFFSLLPHLAAGPFLQIFTPLTVTVSYSLGAACSI